MQALAYLEPDIETATWEAIQGLQEAKLARQLDYLYARSKFYQEKLAGIERSSFRKLADLQRFPFTTKEELRDSQAKCPPLGNHIAADLDDVIRVHSSTGTTGKPSFVGITCNDARVWTAITARSFYTQGMRKSDVTPVGIAMTKDGKTAYVALGHAAHVAIVDVAARKVLGYILVGRRAWGLTLSRDEKTLYVANGLGDDISIIDTASRKAKVSVPVGRVPYGVVVDE